MRRAQRETRSPISSPSTTRASHASDYSHATTEASGTDLSVFFGRPRAWRSRALSRGRATARPSPQAVSAHRVTIAPPRTSAAHAAPLRLNRIAALWTQHCLMMALPARHRERPHAVGANVAERHRRPGLRSWSCLMPGRIPRRLGARGRAHGLDARVAPGAVFLSPIKGEAGSVVHEC
jgi:hypothetical protein